MHNDDFRPRSGSVHEIEIDREELEPTDSLVGDQKKYFYAGTFSGWLDKHQTALTTIGAVIAIIVISLIITVLYVSANANDESFDDEDCWPFSCPSSFYSDAEPTEIDYYWEHYNENHTISSEWAFRLPSPTNRNLYDISYFESTLQRNHFVAVGDDCTILVSENGTNWQLVPPILPHLDLTSIKYSDETFYVETRGGDCYSSPDLYQWEAGPHSFSSGIASSDIVSVGVEHNTVWLRDLSRTWIRVNIRDADKILDITYGNGLFVLLGTTHLENQPDAEYACVWVSEDGVAWDNYLVSNTILQNSDQLQISLTGTTKGRGIFIIFADMLYTSGTGVVWLPVPQSPWIGSAAPTSLSCANSGYCVAFSESGTQTVVSQTSDYGLTWTSTVVGATFFAVTDNNEQTFTGVGGIGNVIQGLTTAGVIVWNQVAPKFGEEISSLIFADEKFVASSEKYVTFQSDDGIEWTKYQTPALTRIAHGREKYIGVFANSVALDIYRSSNGNDWNVVNSFPGYYTISNMIFDGHQFVLTGLTCDPCTSMDDDDDELDENYTPVIYTSSDGTDWILQSTLGTNSFLIDFVWDSFHNCYYSVGADGSMYTSPDLGEWTEVYIQENVECTGVAVNQQTGLAMAIFNPISSDETFIASSSDCGGQWEIIPCSCTTCGPIDTISYHPQQNMFYMGGNEILRTTDGTDLQWTSTRPVSLDSMTTLKIGNGALLVLSEQAIISTSLDDVIFTNTC